MKTYHVEVRWTEGRAELSRQMAITTNGSKASVVRRCRAMVVNRCPYATKIRVKVS